MARGLNRLPTALLSARNRFTATANSSPRDAINAEYFQENETRTVCPWKGTASYYDVKVNGNVNRGAAWYYPSPKAAAKNIKDHVAFWRGVQIRE